MENSVPGKTEYGVNTVSNIEYRKKIRNLKLFFVSWRHTKVCSKIKTNAKY